MRTVSLRLADLCDKSKVPLGRVGDNLHTQVRIDCLKLFEEYPDATASLSVRPPKGDTYPAVVVREGDFIIWNVTDSDLIYPGTGEAQLVFTDGDVVAHKAPFKTVVERSIQPSGLIPTPVQNWVEQANEVLEEVRDAIPEGGTTGQVLAKASNDDYDLEWVDPGSGGTSDYEELDNLPQIGGVTLKGDKSLHDLGAAAESDIPDVSGFYTKPSGGIPSSDMASDVQTSLGKADSAYQKPSGGIPASDMESGAIPDVSGKSDLTNLAPAFSTSSTYAVGDHVTYNGKYYVCSTAVSTAGAWDSSKWTEKTVGAEAQSVLNEKLNAPTNTGTAGQVLGLDNNLAPKWVDQTGGSVDPQDIEDAVDAWLTENITNPDSPPLDRSLSSASSAAPADMLGDVDAELEMQAVTVDLLATATHTDGKKIDENGQIQNTSTYEIWEIEYDGTYNAISAVLYSGSNYLLRAMSFQDENGTALKVLEYLVTSSPYKSEFVDVSVPSGTKKIILANRNSFSPVSATCTIQKSKRLSDIEDDINTIFVFPVSSKNLCDESKKVVGLIYEANGSLMDSYTSHRATDYIEISPSTIYTISAYHKNTGAFNIEGLRYAFYKNDKSFISGAKPEGAYSTFRTPSNAKYIRFSMLQTNNEKWQLERRSFATKYVPFNTITYNDESDEMFLNFPAKTYAVTGLEYNWYLFNVRPEKGENEFRSRYYMPTITGMARYGRFLRMKGSNTSTVARVIGAEAKSLTKYGYKLFSINVKDPTNLSAVSVLILGDSTTANGYVPQYLYEFGGNSHLITTLGTQGTAPYNHEGRSGWRLYDYFNTSSGNPFYNPSTETFDAAYYFTQTGVSQPDIFIINLGINDMHYDSGTLYEAKAHADEYIQMVNDVIESVKGVSPSIKVAICLTTPPNTDPYSFGAAGSNIIDYDDYRIANLVLCEKLIDAYDYRESEGIYLIPINACLDTKYNMPTTTEHPNSRSDLEITVPNNAANVHPNTAGYHQIADEMYAFICSLYVT